MEHIKWPKERPNSALVGGGNRKRQTELAWLEML